MKLPVAVLLGVGESAPVGEGRADGEMEGVRAVVAVGV